jgi:DNA polymerase-4
MSPRAILHIDMDAFFAAVEVLDDPSLAGRPVIVGGTPEGRGVVAAASYEARRYGVHSAMSAARARQLCPQGVFLPGRHRRYREVSRLIFAIFAEYTPLIEPLSIDEAFLDVTGCQRLFGPAETIGRTIKERIRREVGLTASVGVAPNKFLAKLGSDLDKPDGFFVFTQESAIRVLAPLPIERLWGVGPSTSRRLARHGIRTIGDLQAIPPARLAAELGEHAVHLHDLAHGRDERPVESDQAARSIGHEVTFASDIGEESQLREVVDELAAKVGRRLRAHGLLARTVSLKARYSDFTTPTRSATLPLPTDSTRVIRDTAHRLLGERLGRRGRPLRLVGVTVSGLVEAEGAPALFVQPDIAREKTLDGVLDRLHERFGGVIRRGAGRQEQGEDIRPGGRWSPDDSAHDGDHRSGERGPVAHRPASRRRNGSSRRRPPRTGKN